MSSTNVIGFMRITYSEGSNNPSSGPRSTHIQPLFAEISPSGLIEATDIECCRVHPLRFHGLEGSFTLSLLPKAEPSPIPNIRDTVFSLMNEILKLSNNLSETLMPSFLKATAWTSPSLPSSNRSMIRLLLGDRTDADREAYNRKNLITVYHSLGTAKMRSESDADGCDGLEVKGQSNYS
ncbi:hypothetical protein K435DRAFT_859565 [Dendrothele bispora CBS 962.96]|uniref:Uncharacterized protein n=1 Tax=Dendrothele bispora (strain CBS 962.96) TaxID=1314807 RepID=A0A4S8M075_DENBC|nr:hypothetical protein K435DRAFT_859565 [Dendrothele bispora CBS 962.96]